MIYNKYSANVGYNTFSLLRKYIACYSGFTYPFWQRFALSLIQSILGGIFYFLSIYFVNSLKLSISTAGIIISFYGIGAILGGIIGGKLSDIFSPRMVTIFSLFFEANIFMLLTQIQNPIFLSAAVFFLGISIYSFITSNHLSILNQCENNEELKLSALGILAAVSNLGLGLSATFVGLLSIFGFHFLFLTASIILFCLSVYLIFQANLTIPSLKLNSKKENIFQNIESVKNRKSILYLVLSCVFLAGCIISQMSTTYSLYLHKIFPEFGIKKFETVFTINTILVTIFQTPIGKFLNNKNKTLMIGCGAFLLGLGMFSVSFASYFSIIILACIIYTFGEMIFFPCAQLLCYQLGSRSKKGFNLGLFRTTYAASRAAGPIAGSAIYQYLDPAILWYICGFLGLVCFLSCLYFKSMDHAYV